MLTPTTQALLQLQPILYALDGLHATAWKMRAHPNLVMPNFAAQHARQIRQARAPRDPLQHYQPTEAPNDPQQTLPRAP
mgnify:CR=1 FL=1